MPLKLLIVASVEDDLSSGTELLQQSGYALLPRRLADRETLVNTLTDECDWQLCIATDSASLSLEELPALLHQQGATFPLIIVSDSMDERQALAAVRAGAHDILRREEMARLGRSALRALQTANAVARAQANQQRLRELLVQNESAREAERVELARDVHDELGGMLTAIKMDLRWLQKKNCDQDAAAQTKFSRLAEQLDGAINTVRRIITNLRPSVLDDLGLQAAIEWQLDQFEKSSGIRCNLISKVQESDRLAQQDKVTLFRIFQEALASVATHKGVTRVDVKLQCDKQLLQLEICDDSTKITDENNNENGGDTLFGMRERALAIGASLESGSSTSGGNRITLSLPL